MVRKNIIYEHKHLEMIVSETIHIKKKKHLKNCKHCDNPTMRLYAIFLCVCSHNLSCRNPLPTLLIIVPAQTCTKLTEYQKEEEVNLKHDKIKQNNCINHKCTER